MPYYEPTSKLTLRAIFPHSEHDHEFAKDVKPTDTDREVAAAALAWARETYPRDKEYGEGQDFDYSMSVAAHLTYVTHKTAGIVAYIIAAHALHLDKLRRQEIERTTYVEGYLAQVDEKLEDVPGHIVEVRETEGDYGTKTAFKIQSDSGHCIMWWYSGRAWKVKPSCEASDYNEGTLWEVGERVYVSGRVKKTDIYKGRSSTGNLHQTVLTRATLLDEERYQAYAAEQAAKKTKKPRAKKQKETA